MFRIYFYSVATIFLFFCVPSLYSQDINLQNRLNTSNTVKVEIIARAISNGPAVGAGCAVDTIHGNGCSRVIGCQPRCQAGIVTINSATCCGDVTGRARAGDIRVSAPKISIRYSPCAVPAIDDAEKPSKNAADRNTVIRIGRFTGHR